VITAVWAVTAAQKQRDAETRFEAAVSHPATDEGELDELDDAARDLLSFRPGFGRVYTRVGEAHLFAGDAEGAMGWLAHAVDLLPTDPVTLTALAIAEIELADLERAQVLIDDCIALDPGTRDALVAHLLSRHHDVDLWLAVAGSPEMGAQLADALIDEGRYFEAMSFASRLLGHSADDVLGLDLACRAAMGLGLDELSLRFAGSLHELDPDSITADLAVAGEAVSRGDLDRAIDLLEGALERSPDSHALRFALGGALVTSAELGEERESYEERVESIRERLRLVFFEEEKLEIEYYLLSARFFCTTEHWSAAVTAATHGAEIAPDNVYFHLILALALENLEYQEDAAYRRSRARAIDPTAVYPEPISEPVATDGVEEPQLDDVGEPTEPDGSSDDESNDREDRE